MFDWWRVRAVARRLGLRDKGKTRVANDTATVHGICKTRIRVGIDQHGTSVLYCWRCEKIMCTTTLEPYSPPFTPSNIEKEGKVVPFKRPC